MNYDQFNNLFYIGNKSAIAKAKPFQNDSPTVKSIMVESSDDFKKEAAKLLRSDLVVTCEDWETKSQSVKLVKLARLANIEIVHFISYKKCL